MYETAFIAADGNEYIIRIDDCGEEITVARGDVDLGSISLQFVEVDERTPAFDHYWLTHLELKSPTRCGIGRRCFEFHREVFGRPIHAAENDGIRRDDGSHLTEGGPGFVAAMRELGLIVATEYEGEEN